MAVVTGGAGAIGGAIVRELADRGHRVVVVDRAGDISCDLGSEQQVRTAAAEILAEYGRVDVLVHAAAATDLVELDSLDLSVWRRVQAVNVESALLLSQAFVPGMRERHFGRIVFVTSDTIWKPPSPDLLGYIASKGALTALARSLATSLGSNGVTVTTVAPGLTRTGATAYQPDEAFAAAQATQALPRPLTPHDVAATVGFLASDAAEALTGQVLVVDGGTLLR
ncbi:SDR family NAD(P)-dependent oxidoreductase [Paractinoplanes toevensis]|uniref:SDR family NAD(P)-dependent oxidoreductase n=1 Tax=Paractinoplanes toevensis TaxID=571911 RepID=UPI001BB3F01A|nr:SDR family oxidoreductase [Actinoplanes toevensis]